MNYPLKVGKSNYYCQNNDIGTINYDFVSSFNSHHFTQICTDIEKSNSSNSDLLIRTIYSQALESFFAYIFATLQAPHQIVSWLHLYSINDITYLKDILESKKLNLEIFMFHIEPFSWEGVAKLLTPIDENENKYKEYIQNLEQLLKSLSIEFSDMYLRSEYNSIKHGFRIKPGEYNLSIGDNKLKASLFEKCPGSVFYKLNKKKSQRSTFMLEKSFKNWDKEYYLNRIELMSKISENLSQLFNKYIINKKTKNKFWVFDNIDYKRYITISHSHTTIKNDTQNNPKEIDIEKSHKELNELYKQKLFILPEKI